MVTELINTGSELMLGRVLNTHQQWLCSRLADLGYVVSRQVAVPDTASAIQTALQESLGRADLVIVTGGLGPTSDDLTRDYIAAMLKKPLREDSSVLAHIERFFTERKRPMPERTRVQAMVPEGASVLHNAFGTAPGLAIHVQPNPFRPASAGTWIIMLPGPPRELRPMFSTVVVPLLKRALPAAPQFVCRTLRSTGIGESIVEARLIDPLDPLVKAGLEIGYCARPGEVDVRLTASGATAELLVAQAISIVRAELASSVYTSEAEEIEEVVVRLLKERKQTLALAESCTGGCVANRITNVPGASAVFLASAVTYSNAAKQQFLGVDPETISTCGAVSDIVARQMAEGVRGRTGADYALSLTGIAGPSGGSAEKPVGTVFIGLATPEKTTVHRYVNAWERETFKQVSAQQALELLRRSLLARP